MNIIVCQNSTQLIPEIEAFQLPLSKSLGFELRFVYFL